MDRYAIVKSIVEQCKTEADLIGALPSINAFFRQENPTQEVAERKSKPKKENRARSLALEDYPRRALVHLKGRAQAQQIWDWMKEQGVDYLLPEGRELQVINNFFAKNLNRTYRRFPDGSWGFCKPPKELGKNSEQ